VKKKQINILREAFHSRKHKTIQLTFFNRRISLFGWFRLGRGWHLRLDSWRRSGSYSTSGLLACRFFVKRARSDSLAQLGMLIQLTTDFISSTVVMLDLLRNQNQNTTNSN
jgi:hypothetical protein